MTTLLPDTTVPGFTGTLLTPADPGFDEARSLFNGMVDRRPALIARCASASDVRAVVCHAVLTGTPLSVKAGGHGVAGQALVEDGLVVDLSGMREVVVDPVARMATVAGGATWGDVDAACAPHGLAVTGGRMSTTGVGGLTLSSGSGWLERSLGLSADSLLAVEVVTAAGEVVRADAGTEPELFWALRGGGGAFGVVTSFTFRLHPVPEALVAGLLLWPADQAPHVARAIRDLADVAPDALAVAMAMVTAPPAPFVPPALQGRPAFGAVVVANAEPGEGEALVAPFRALAPAVDLVGPMPYAEGVQRLIEDASPHGARNFWKAGFLSELPDEALDAALVAGGGEKPPLSQHLLLRAGGAIARVPEDATALSHRRAGWSYHLLGMWHDPAQDEAAIAHVRAVDAALRPWSLGAYPNWLSDAGPDEVQRSFGAAKAERLRAVKRRWDPTGVFARHTGLPA